MLCALRGLGRTSVSLKHGPGSREPVRARVPRDNEMIAVLGFSTLRDYY
jgi:hypothetical protein